MREERGKENNKWGGGVRKGVGARERETEIRTNPTHPPHPVLHDDVILLRRSDEVANERIESEK